MSSRLCNIQNFGKNREVGLKSPNMEREAMICAVDFLRCHLNIDEMITDASTSVHKTIGKFCM